MGEIREGVTAHVLTGPASGSATGLLSAVPVGVCVQLVELWHAAQAAGFTQIDLTAPFVDEDKLVFEMVVGMYDTACHIPLPLLLESVAKLRDALA